MSRLRTEPNLDDPDGVHMAFVSRALRAAVGRPA